MNRSRVRAPPLGFASLMTTSTRGVHNSPGIPRPTMFRPQRFARSRRLTPPRALRACFIALPCPGFSLQGLLPPFEPHHLVGGRYPRAVGVARLPVARRQQNVASTSGSCSRSESAVSARRLSRASLVSPPAFHTPAGIHPRPWKCHRTPSARGLGGSVLRVPRTVDPQRIVDPRFVASVPRGDFPFELSGLRVGCPSREAHQFRAVVATADEILYEHSACQASRACKRSDRGRHLRACLSSAVAGAADNLLTSCASESGAGDAARG